MYIFVIVQEKQSYRDVGSGLPRVQARLEQASGEPCVTIPYQEINMRVVRQIKPRAIAFSGFGHFQERRPKWFFGLNEIYHEADLPMLCFCGSHQLLGHCFTSDITKLKEIKDMPMRKLKDDEDLPRRPSPHPEYDLSKYFIAFGFYPIRQVKPDPLFRGLPKVMHMWCHHYCEVKKLPPGFELLATSKYCRIEAMKHKTRPLYSTQFHPENYDEPFFHGRTLLKNFTRIVDDFWKKK